MQGQFKPVIRSCATRILAAYFLMVGLLSLVLGAACFRQQLRWVSPAAFGILLPNWFIETYLQTIMLLLILFSIPSVRKSTKNAPSETAWAFFATPVILSVASLIPLENGWVFWPTPNMILHVFVVEILTCIAKSTTGKALVAAAILVSATLIYPAHNVQAIGFAIGTLLLLLSPPVCFSKPVSKLLNLISPAGLMIYLLHIPIFRVLAEFGVPVMAKPIIAVGIGIAIHYAFPIVFERIRNFYRRENKHEAIRDRQETLSVSQT